MRIDLPIDYNFIKRLLDITRRILCYFAKRIRQLALSSISSEMARRGALILFEGVDRCGKTTQAKKLAEALNDAGQATLFMRFPGEGHIDELICKACTSKVGL